MSSDSRQQVWDVYAKAIEVFDQKNADYGDAWRTNGWRGNLSRIFEKVQRVRNLAWRPDPRVPAVGDEAVLETLQDLLNTTAFAIINMSEEVEYGHEVPRSQRLVAVDYDYQPGEAMTFFDQVSEALPHAVVRKATADELSSLNVEGVRTEIIDGGMVSAALVTGPDEQGPAEVKHTRKRVVRDNPQA